MTSVDPETAFTDTRNSDNAVLGPIRPRAEDPCIPYRKACPRRQ